jgi:hypothetical protein
VAAALCWSMGSSVLIEPWNPHSMVLPFLAFLFLAWSTASGDLVAVPLAALVGSLVAQTHLSYVLLVLVLGGWAAVGLLLELRRRKACDPVAWSALRRRAVRAGAWAAAAVGVCWAQPLGQQLFGEGRGNLSTIASVSFSGDSEKIGLSDALRVVADVLALPPGWLPPSFDHPWDIAYFPSGVPRPAAAAAGLLVVAALLAGCHIVARRLGDRVLGLAVVTAGIGLGSAVLNAAGAPLTVAGVPIHHFRWLWALGAFVGFALLLTVARVLVRSAVGRAWTAPVLAVAVAVVALAGLPRSEGGSQPGWTVPVMRRVAGELDALEGRGPLFVRSPGLDDHFTVGILAELRRRGIPFTVDRNLSRQLGEGRRARGDPGAELRVLLGEGVSAGIPEEWEVVVSDRGPLSPAQRREVARLNAELPRELADGSIRTRVHPAIEPFLESGQFPALGDQRRRGVWDPDELLSSGELLPLVDVGLVVTDDREHQLAERLRPLQERLDVGTVTVVIIPATG